MNGNDILKVGYPRGVTIGLALQAAKEAKVQRKSKDTILEDLTRVLATPDAYVDDEIYGPVAESLLAEAKKHSFRQTYNLEREVPYRVWGASGIEPGAVEQLKRAAKLPVAVRAALMPDAHVGYGLPIGGVLATENSVIPYAVGVDIACRMRLSVFDASPYVLEQKREKFRKILENNTIFGTGQEWAEAQDHEVLQDPLWREHPVARRFKDVAWRQLGTSGSGNHFVEFGALEAQTEIATPQGTIPPGKVIAEKKAVHRRR
jgi:tRNA-splicing ligase RtcB